MKLSLGILFAVTQAPKKGGIMRSFDVCSDGLFPAPDLGKFGLEHWRFKELFSYWKYATLDYCDNEYQADPSWATYQMTQRFNDHYKNNFEHGCKVTVDERILWGWERVQPGGGHKFDREPRGFGPEYKCLSTVGFQVTTTFENVIRNEVKKKGNIPRNMVLVLLLSYVYVKLLE